MGPHSSNSIENATPSSGTSPLASYKEFPPPPGGGLKRLTDNFRYVLRNSSEIFGSSRDVSGNLALDKVKISRT